MELLTLLNNRLQVSPYALTINEFKVIWDRDTTATKDIAIKELSFVYFMADSRSPYRGYDSPLKEMRIKEDIGLVGWDFNIQVVGAVTKYIQLQTTPSMRMLKAMEQSLSKIEQFFSTYNPSADLTGSKFRALTNSYKEVPNMIKGLRSMEELVAAEQEVGIVSRGGHAVSKREVPRERRKKNE